MDFFKVYRVRQRRRLERSGIPRRLRLIRLAVVGIALSVLGFFVVLTGAFVWYSRDLPSPDRIVRREGFSTKILARAGDVLYDVHGDVAREPVRFEDIPTDLKHATVAIEDKHFYTHEGFDPLGILRALFNTVVRGRLQGGSTLTQQLVKNVLLTSSRSLPRKIKEFVLSVQIEKKFSKDQILQMYIQEAPYGGAAVGAEVAARTYFGKPLRELSLVESAFLAGMPQAPSRYSPYGSNQTAYIDRTKQVVRRMREDGYINQDQERQATDELPSLQFRPPGGAIEAPHFVMYVRDLLVKQFGEETVEAGGLVVTTTLDLPLQQKAQQIVSEEIEKARTLDISNGASIVMDPTSGEILSMVGSRDFFETEIDGQVNVTLSKRQPGSAIKPITYAAALRKGYTPSTMLVDTKISFDSGDPEKPYEPENYDGKFHGPVQLRFALGSSLNLPAVELLQLVGLKDMLSLAYEMGISTLEPSTANFRRLGLSVTLGGGEVRLIDLVSAYSSFSNGGTKIEPIAILRVTDSKGRVLSEHHKTRGKQVLSSQEAFLITNILSDNNARLLTFGVNSLLNMGPRPVAVKTGTTNDKRDNWALGWSRSVIVGAWVGNNDNSPMKEVASGVSGASPIWRRTMIEALSTHPSDPFEVPAGIVRSDVDTLSGYKAHDGWPSRQESLIEGTVSDQSDPIHTKIAVCKSDGKLAGPVEIARGDTEEREFIVLKAPSLLGVADRERWQQGIDAWVATQTDSRYHPPTEACSSKDDVIIRLKQPSDQTRINTNNLDWEADVISAQKPEKVELFANGTSRQTLTQPPWKSTLNLSDGTYVLKVKARIEGGKEAESSEVKIGINRDWNAPPAGGPTPTMTPSPTPTP